MRCETGKNVQAHAYLYQRHGRTPHPKKNSFFVMLMLNFGERFAEKEEAQLGNGFMFLTVEGGSGTKPTKVFPRTGVFHSRREKCHARSPLSSRLTSLVPFQGRAPRCWLLSPPPRPPPGEGLPRPRGPDGAAGRDAADPALSHATFRLPGLSGGGGAQS